MRHKISKSNIRITTVRRDPVDLKSVFINERSFVGESICDLYLTTYNEFVTYVQNYIMIVSLMSNPKLDHDCLSRDHNGQITLP